MTRAARWTRILAGGLAAGALVPGVWATFAPGSLADDRGEMSCGRVSRSVSEHRLSVMHTTIDPAILYVGTPVVLISTENLDGSANLAPMSSAWWLGHRCMLGLATGSQTTANLRRTRECVLNLPSEDLVGHVDRIARTTGSDPVPEGKLARGYRHVHAKFQQAGLTADPSDLVRPPRVRECRLQFEATLVEDRAFGPKGGARALEVQVERVHADEDVLVGTDRIDPARWRPLIMSFQRFWGLADHEAGPSDLAQIPEAMYR